MPQQRPWVTTLRASLKQEHGFGWGIREKQGKVQLTRRFEDLSRSSVTLDVSWDARCLSEVMVMEEHPVAKVNAVGGATVTEENRVRMLGAWLRQQGQGT